MDQIIIRKAGLNDLGTLLRFEQELIAAERPFDSTLQDGEIHYYDIPAMIAAPHVALLVAVINEQLIGTGYARIEEGRHYLKHRQHAYLGFMYVDPVYRGKGVNRAIMEVLKNWALEQGIRELRLDVYYSNEQAIKAYEKAGFHRHLIEMRMGL